MYLLSLLCISLFTIGSSAHLGSPRLRPSITKTPSPPFSHHHYPIPTPPPLPLSLHTCQIPVTTATSLLPKYFSTSPPVVATHPPAATMAHGTSPLPHISYPLHKSQILAEGPLTPLPLLASHWYIPSAVWCLPPEVTYPDPPLSKYFIPAFSPSSPSPVAENPRVPPQAC